MATTLPEPNLKVLDGHQRFGPGQCCLQPGRRRDRIHLRNSTVKALPTSTGAFWNPRQPAAFCAALQFAASIQPTG